MGAVDLESVNDVFTVLCGVWVLFFKFGFAFVEAGKTDPHHTANVFLKNTADTFISLVAFWLHGYAFAFGEHNSFIGGQFFLTLDGTNMTHFFFNYVRCAVATTVALGAVNERTEPIGYLISGYVFAGAAW
nr:PREDICTED: putative ammonium transporter 1 [Lepisosteus oculatus]